MTPTDIGISAGALLLLVYAARTMVSKEGRAQMGCGFAVAAAVLWSLALGRGIPNFTTQDGLRLALGALLLLPAFRALFQHGKGSVVSGAVGLVMASIVAGPVVQRYLDQAGILEGPHTAAEQLAATDAEIDRKEVIRVELTGKLLTLKRQLQDLDAARTDKSEEAMVVDSTTMDLMQAFSRVQKHLAATDQRLSDLRTERAKLSAVEADSTRSLTEIELEQIRRDVHEASRKEDKSALELYTEQQELLELYRREIRATKTPE